MASGPELCQPAANVPGCAACIDFGCAACIDPGCAACIDPGCAACIDPGCAACIDPGCAAFIDAVSPCAASALKLTDAAATEETCGPASPGSAWPEVSAANGCWRSTSACQDLAGIDFAAVKIKDAKISQVADASSHCVCERIVCRRKLGRFCHREDGTDGAARDR